MPGLSFVPHHGSNYTTKICPCTLSVNYNYPGHVVQTYLNTNRILAGIILTGYKFYSCVALRTVGMYGITENCTRIMISVAFFPISPSFRTIFCSLLYDHIRNKTANRNVYNSGLKSESGHNSEKHKFSSLIPLHNYFHYVRGNSKLTSDLYNFTPFDLFPYNPYSKYYLCTQTCTVWWSRSTFSYLGWSDVGNVFWCKLLQKCGLPCIIQSQEEDPDLLVWRTLQFTQNWQ